MTKQISSREWEAISAYLDNQLSEKERARLEARLREDSGLRTALEDLRRTRILLRSQPKLRAPRNFTLTPEMVGRRVQERPAPRGYPAFRLAAVLASILLVFVLVGDFLTGSGPLGARQSAPTEAISLRAAAPQAPPGPDVGFGGGGPQPTSEAAQALEGSPIPPEAALASKLAEPTATPMPTMAAEAPQPSPEGTPETGMLLAAPQQTPTPGAEMKAMTAPQEAYPQIAYPEQTGPAQDASQGQPLESLSNRAGWRIAEIILAAVALLSAAAAIALHRVRAP